MKKITAIFLLLIFLFNIGGYRLWYYYAQQQSDKQLEASLDKNEYDEADLITVKVPLSLPYQTNWKEFERVDGEINIKGKIYKYVKRKVENGELVLLCIPDHNKMQLETAKDDFFKSVNDLIQNNSSKKSTDSKSTAFKNLLSEYCQHTIDINKISIYDSRQVFRLSYTAENLISSPHISPEQPPDFI